MRIGFGASPEQRRSSVSLYKMHLKTIHIDPFPTPRTLHDSYLSSTTHPAFSMRVRLGADICHCLVDGVNGVSLLVRNLDAELFLNRHDDLDRIQAVQAEVVSKVRSSRDLRPSVYTMLFFAIN